METALVLRATNAGDFERAVIHGRKASAAVKDLPNAFVLLGIALIRTGLAGPMQAYGAPPRIRDLARIEEAVEAFDKAVALPPESSSIRPTGSRRFWAAHIGQLRSWAKTEKQKLITTKPAP